MIKRVHNLKKKLQKAKAIGFRQTATLAKKHLFFEKVFPFFEKFGIHVLPVHYYDPIPDTRELRRNLNLWYKEGTFSGVDFNIKEQLQLLNKLKNYKIEYDMLPSNEELDEKGFGEGYNDIDSCILHAMIRFLKPNIIIEIGSGISTYFSVNALSLNKERDKVDSKIICIEPYPRRPLKKIRGNCEIQIIPKPVQEIEIDFFNILDKDDILFIDSSHIVKIGSDVNYLYLEVLPNLKKGVVIHIHDIPFPYPISNPEDFIFKKHLFLTEPALVHAFLMYNSVFKIILCSSYLHHKKRDALLSAFTNYDLLKHWPSSLWLRKIA